MTVLIDITALLVASILPGLLVAGCIFNCASDLIDYITDAVRTHQDVKAGRYAPPLSAPAQEDLHDHLHE